MARIRSIHPDALKSEKLAAVSAEAERCYWRLATHCDDEGRAEDDPQILAAFLFPRVDSITAEVMAGWLDELALAGLLVRYECGGRYLEVTRWKDYQKPNKPTPSKYPPPTAQLPDDSRSGQVAVSIGDGVGVGDGVGGRKRRPPHDFQPTEEHKTYARDHGLTLADERVQWLTWCEANGKTYARVNAGFSTWLQRAVGFGRGTKANGQAPVGAVNPQRELERCPVCEKLTLDCSGHPGHLSKGVRLGEVTTMFKKAAR